MKKKLLTLGALAVVMSANAQSVIFYSGDNSKVFVSKDALVYTGGSFKLDAAQEKAVENKGMITIVGDYVKGTANTIDGKEFVNVYTAANDYGQVKLLSATGASDARMTTQRPAASTNYFGASYAMSFPYKDQVSYVMKSFGLEESAFRGDCGLDVSCGNRYKMNLTKWNNNKLQHDAVQTANTFKAGDYYNLNLREPNMQAVMTGTIGYKGTPDGRAYTQAAKGVIIGLDEQTFSGLGYNEWKKRMNSYKEAYETYLGYVSSTSKVLNKNVYRFGNPYTSNLDLSDFGNGSNPWLKIKNGGDKTIKEATEQLFIKNFTITKRMSTYDVNWGPVAGGINATGAETYHIVKFDGTQWQGSAEALLIRPTETFNLNFLQLDPSKLGSRIIEAEVNFNDNHKTYDYVAGATKTQTTGLTSKSAATMKSAAAASVAKDFYQAEVALMKDNVLDASPVYLVGSSKYSQSGVASETSAKIFVYGVNGDSVALNSKKQFNEFNSNDYVGKPLALGLAGLSQGATYSLSFNLAEGDIFTSVKNFSDAKLYLKDNTNNKVVEVTADKTISFVAGTAEENRERFVFYWKETPVTLSTENANVTSSSTIVYKEGTQNKVKFENTATKANVEVYDASGRLVLSETGVNTVSDFVLNLAAGQASMYVVKVTYLNGEVRTIKFVK